MYIIKCSLRLTTYTVLLTFKQCDGKAKGAWITKYVLFCVLILALGLALSSEKARKALKMINKPGMRFEK